MDIFPRICEIIKDKMSISLDFNVNIHFKQCYSIRMKVNIYSDKNADIHIGIDQSLTREWLQYYKERYGRFLNNLNIELNEYTLFTLLLLHEYGHIAHFIIFHYKGRYHDKIKYCKAAISGIFKIPRTTNNPYGAMNRCLMYPDELYADRFAFENFMPIWNEVKYIVNGG